MREQLYQGLKNNRVMLVNVVSLVCTTLTTGALAFTYWWVAARQFHPNVVGLASAAVSAMMLLGAICGLGLGTLLIVDLPRQPGKEASLISTALLLTGIAGGIAGILFALVAPFISVDLRPLGATIENVLLFAAGVSLTSITIVLDQSLMGLLHGELQFWRNTLFAATKLAAIIAIGLGVSFFTLHKRDGIAIYATWAIGNIISLVPLILFVLVKKGSSLRHALPDWSLLRKLSASVLLHHVLYLIRQVPTLALPVLVTILLSATKNGWFYIAWMISGFVFTAIYALTTVLYAINATEPEEFARKMRLTLNLTFIISLVANIVIQIGASQILGLFGYTYAVQAAWSLRIVSMAAFPLIIKFHYIAVSYIDNKMLRVLFLAALGSLIELGAAALGAHLADLLGLSMGWTIAVCIEAVFMAPVVFKAIQLYTQTMEVSPLTSALLETKQEAKTIYFTKHVQEKILQPLSFIASFVNLNKKLPLFSNSIILAAGLNMPLILNASTSTSTKLDRLQASSSLIEENKRRFSIKVNDRSKRTFLYKNKKYNIKIDLDLFVIAWASLELDDFAIVDKIYTIQAGISQHETTDFHNEPFKIVAPNSFEPLLFGILFHPSENIVLIGKQYQHLAFDPSNVNPQFISCALLHERSYPRVRFLPFFPPSTDTSATRSPHASSCFWSCPLTCSACVLG